ncbi:MAG: polysaccharide biosynthesis protein [Bacteroidales bacterium]|nr:polysaccharide biosynthesis protein [Bacteroidales bacterium]
MPERLKRYMYEYLDTRVVFFIDLALSCLSSVLVLFLITLFANSKSAYQGHFVLWWLVGAAIASLAALLLFQNYKVVIRHSQLRDLVNIFWISILKVVLMFVVLAIVRKIVNPSTVLLGLLIDFLLTSFLLIALRLSMIFVYDRYKSQLKAQHSLQRVLVYGITEKSVATVSRLKDSPHYQVVGFLVPHALTAEYKVNETRVYGYESENKLKELVDRFTLDCILFATEAEAKTEKDGLVRFCSDNGLKVLLAPTIDEVVGGRIMKNKVRAVRIEDLLGREEIRLNVDEIKAECEGKVIMVTGAAGSIGSELCRQLAAFGIKKLILYDNAETPMHNIRLELEGRFPQLDFVPVIGDVRQMPRLDYVFRKWHPQIVFHAAAYKHVPLMEENPCEAVLVNVHGSRNVADKCIEYGVEKMVMISTDKAVNPTNIMGCTKRLAEIYVQSLGLALEAGKVQGKTKFVTTRFGNVLGSNGSVIPRFREQIEKGGPVTVTDPRITRYFMTIPEACRLVMEAMALSKGNQIFAFDMGESVKIDDLARKMISLAGLKVGKDIEIEYTGLRPGEKLYEEVLSNAENTEPTSHDRIRIARVRQYEYADAKDVVDKLETLSRDVEIPDMVMLMKKTVPEFKSENSKFCMYD